jgi:hypothetical protein
VSFREFSLLARAFWSASLAEFSLCSIFFRAASRDWISLAESCRGGGGANMMYLSAQRSFPLFRRCDTGGGRGFLFVECSFELLFFVRARRLREEAGFRGVQREQRWHIPGSFV